MDSKQGEDSTAKASILAVNQLTYQLAPDLSVAVSRTMVRQYPMGSQKVTSRDTLVFVLNSGSAYVDFRDSYLSIDVKNISTGVGQAFFGTSGGSACNFFNRLTISSRSGQIIERIDRVNQLSCIRHNFERSEVWKQTTGSLMGLDVSAANLDWDSGDTVRFVIPLGSLSVFFNTCDQLVPCQLASGMRIELLLEDGKQAMVQGNSTPTASAFEISNATLNLQSYLLSDVVLRSLNEMSASSGLELVHSTVYSAVGQRSSSLLTSEIGKSASRCLKAIYHERAVTSAALTVDPFAPTWTTGGYYVQELQWRLGSLFFPNTSIRGDGPRESAPELYAMALQAFGQMTGSAPTISTTEQEYRQGKAVYAQSFERSSVLDLAGQPSSNSRIISLVSRFSDTAVHDSSFYLFFAQLIRVFSSNAVVEQ